MGSRKSNNISQTERVVSAAKKGAIERAYSRREKDLESLRKYDKGEKEINAPTIRRRMPSV